MENRCDELEWNVLTQVLSVKQKRLKNITMAKLKRILKTDLVRGRSDSTHHCLCFILKLSLKNLLGFFSTHTFF